MLQVDTCGEGRIATVVEIDFSGVYNLGSRLSAEFFVVPVGGTHALLSVGSAQVVELALEDFIACVATTLNEPGLWSFLPDAVKNGNRLCGCSSVVTPEHQRVVGIGTHDHNLLLRVEWEQMITILQQHHAFAGYLQRLLFVLLAGYHAHRNLRPLNHVVGVEVTQLKACFEQSLEAGVDLLFRNLASLHGLGQRLVFAAALHIGSGNHGTGSSIGTRW